MSLIKYIREKEFHNPCIDGVMSGVGYAIGELLYEIAEKKSMRSIYVKENNIGSIAGALNKLDGRACQLRSYYSNLYERSRKFTEDHKTLETFYTSEDVARKFTKLLFFSPIPVIYMLAVINTIGQ